MKRRHLAMGAALLAAAALVLFGDSAPESELAEAVERPSAPRVAALAAAPAKGGEPAILRLVARAELIGADGDAIGGADNVFGSQNWTPPPPPAPPASKEAPPPPPAPVAPPLPFTFLGKAAADGSWDVFLARGDQTYIVKTKSVIDGTYRVDSIAPPIMTLTYLPLNQVQQLNIGVLD